MTRVDADADDRAGAMCKAWSAIPVAMVVLGCASDAATTYTPRSPGLPDIGLSEHDDRFDSCARLSHFSQVGKSQIYYVTCEFDVQPYPEVPAVYRSTLKSVTYALSANGIAIDPPDELDVPAWPAEEWEAAP